MARIKGLKDPTYEELWEAHKDLFTNSRYPITKEQFESTMDQIKKRSNLRTPGAWKVFLHSERFVDPTRRGFENLVSNIKNQGDDYKQLRKEVFGWKNKVDFDKVEYNDGIYYYTNTKGQKFKFELISGTVGSLYWTWTSL